MSVRLRRIRGNDARVPRTDPGEAIVIERYGKERAIVLHPEDFHRVRELDQLAEDAAVLEPLNLSEEAIRAHREEGTPGEPVTDPAIIEKLFG
jgi:PHD/YefM family antitoxin component YafN of YafNO toxin-antitoxin module